MKRETNELPVFMANASKSSSSSSLLYLSVAITLLADPCNAGRRATIRGCCCFLVANVESESCSRSDLSTLGSYHCNNNNINYYCFHYNYNVKAARSFGSKILLFALSLSLPLPLMAALSALQLAARSQIARELTRKLADLVSHHI